MFVPIADQITSFAPAGLAIKLSIVEEFVLDSHHMGFNINLTEAFPS